MGSLLVQEREHTLAYSNVIRNKNDRRPWATVVGVRVAAVLPVINLSPEVHEANYQCDPNAQQNQCDAFYVALCVLIHRWRISIPGDPLASRCSVQSHGA